MFSDALPDLTERCVYFRLSELREVQVADYGLYKDLYNVDVYQRDTDKHRALVKWTAPEVLEAEDLSAVTTKSDVVCKAVRSQLVVGKKC